MWFITTNGQLSLFHQFGRSNPERAYLEWSLMTYCTCATKEASGWKQMILRRGNQHKEKIIRWFTEGEQRIEANVDKLCQIYIPINDNHHHWYLGVIDFEEEKVYLCDTMPSRKHNDHRMSTLRRIDTLAPSKVDSV